MTIDINKIKQNAPTIQSRKSVEELISTTQKVIDSFRGYFEENNQQLIVYCPENTQKNIITFELKGHKEIPDVIDCPYGKPKSIYVKDLNGKSIGNDTLLFTKDGFQLRTEELIQKERFNLEFEYPLKSLHFLDALIERNRAKELPKERESEYWLHAELKHPSVFKTAYGNLELRDIDFNVNVGISGDIKTVIPPVFRRELDAAVRLIHEPDPHKKFKLGLQHSYAMKARGKSDDVLKSLSNLQQLFFPSKFCKFIDVQDDFQYSDCLQGANYYDAVPFPTWPKSMKVISRTTLNLEKCASEGKVIYKKDDFLDQVSKVLG